MLILRNILSIYLLNGWWLVWSTLQVFWMFLSISGNFKTFCKIPMQTILGTVSPSGEGAGHCVDPHLPEKFVCPPMSPTVLTQRCRFCNFYAVFGHFAELVSPTSQTHLEESVRYHLFSTIAKFSEKLTSLTRWYAQFGVRMRG